jgi:UDP-N-acetyl-D-mannosaminuronic acid dehydrogenase
MSRYKVLDRLANMEKIVVVGGGGHVGLPLCLVLADAGFHVEALDISESTVTKINQGIMPFIEEGAEQLLEKTLKEGTFRATLDRTSVSEADVVIVVIGTPVDENLMPNPNTVVDSVLDLKDNLRNDQLVILRSTVFPGVTRKLEEKLHEIFPKIEIAFCPERIVEGQALHELRTLPQIAGVREDKVFEKVSKLFGKLGVESIKTTPEEAELAKLFTNVWRYIKFSAANQFWMMANDFGVDYENVRNAIIYKYERAKDLPRPGFTAGPCLFKDTMQLSALVQQNFPLGNASMMINEGLPGYLVSKIEANHNLGDLTVGILGMTFKGDTDDTRSSLAFKLKKILEFKAKKVIFSDPFIKDIRNLPTDQLLSEADLIIIGAPHSVYKNLDTAKEVIDIWAIRNKSVLI